MVLNIYFNQSLRIGWMVFAGHLATHKFTFIKACFFPTKFSAFIDINSGNHKNSTLKEVQLLYVKLYLLNPSACQLELPHITGKN